MSVDDPNNNKRNGNGNGAGSRDTAAPVTAADLLARVEDPRSLRLLVGGDEIAEVGYDKTVAEQRARDILSDVVKDRKGVRGLIGRAQRRLSD